MTVSTKSGLPSDLLTQLETIKPQMNHISSDMHWVQLETHIRGILRNALHIAEHDEISEALSLPVRFIGIWHEQSKALEDLRAEMIRHQQEQPNTPLGNRDDLIEIIAAFIHGTTAKNLAKALGDIVSSTTILRWLRKAHGVREIRILVDKNGQPISKSSANVENLTDEFMASPASASVELKSQLEAEAGLDPYFDVEETSTIFVEVIKELDDQPSNSHVLLTLDTLATWLLRYGYKKCLPTLWSSIDKKCRDNRNITSRRWQQVSAYLHNKIGDPMFIKPE